MKKRRDKSSVQERKKEVLDALRQFGGGLYDQMEKGVFPNIEMPSRSTDNILYNSEVQQYVLGEKTVRRTTRNVRHIRPFSQLVWTAYFAKELTELRKSSTLRDVYYSAQAYDMPFKDQKKSNQIIIDLETVLGFSREDFNIFPEERSAVFGDLTIEYTVPGYEGRQLNLASHPDGMMIGPALTYSELIETTSDKVIVIEKGAMFTRFVEEQVYKKFNALLIYTAGQSPRATRYFVQRLNKEMGLPVFIFTDGDPWGMHIAMVLISGSANAAHLRELTIPGAEWAGVWATDIAKYKLPSEKLSEVDVKRLYELRKDPRYKGDLWQRETKTFLRIKRKCELEAFSRYGLTHIVDKYLPERFKELES